MAKVRICHETFFDHYLTGMKFERVARSGLSTLQYALGETDESFDSLKPSDVSKALDVIEKQSEQYHELARSMHEGHMSDKQWLQGVVTDLVRENRSPLRTLPEPVGRTVRTMAIGKDDPLIIDEPAAEVLRSHEGLELGGAS